MTREPSATPTPASEADPLRPRASPLGLTGFALGAAGSLVLSVAFFVRTPVPVLVGATAALVVGTVLAVIEAYRRSRAEGVGYWRALGRTLKFAVRWFIDMAP